MNTSGTRSGKSYRLTAGDGLSQAITDDQDTDLPNLIIETAPRPPRRALAANSARSSTATERSKRARLPLTTPVDLENHAPATAGLELLVDAAHSTRFGPADIVDSGGAVDVLEASEPGPVPTTMEPIIDPVPKNVFAEYENGIYNDDDYMPELAEPVPEPEREERERVEAEVAALETDVTVQQFLLDEVEHERLAAMPFLHFPKFPDTAPPSMLRRGATSVVPASVLKDMVGTRSENTVKNTASFWLRVENTVANCEDLRQNGWPGMIVCLVKENFKDPADAPENCMTHAQRADFLSVLLSKMQLCFTVSFLYFSHVREPPNPPVGRARTSRARSCPKPPRSQTGSGRPTATSTGPRKTT